MNTRRDFLKTTTVLTAGSLIVPQFAWTRGNQPTSSGPEKLIGLQLYTLREKIPEDLKGTLQKVADIGYKLLEGYGYGNRKILDENPNEFKKIVEDLGMTMPSMHVVTELSTDEIKQSIMDQWKITVEDMALAGTGYIVYAVLREDERKNLDDYRKWAERFNQFGEISKEAGIQFAYHNHDFEFIDFDGEMGYNVLLNETDPELVKMEPDLYWMTKGKQDPVEYFEKYPGRFELWHLKDMEEETQAFAEVGYGIIDFERIFKVRKKAGLKMYFVEQDVCKRDPFESIKMSFDYLNEAEFV